MAKKKTAASYQEAFEELKSILENLQQGETGIDEMSRNSKRAAELLKYCRERLRQTKAEIDTYLTEEE